MSFFWTLIAILVAVIWVITVIDVFRRHLGAAPTAGWVLLVILLPFVGALIYWIVRKPSVDEVDHYAEVRTELRHQEPRARPPAP